MRYEKVLVIFCLFAKMEEVMKILIVDDERDILEIMAEEFTFKGHVVSTASSGNEAIEILKRDTFDVIVSDFKMPNGNGMTVLNYVKTLNPRPRFFFVSGYADLSVSDCIKAGATDFFPKPFDLDILVSEVENKTA